MYANAIQTINYWDDVQSNSIKTIFVCEFITGGGLNDSDLPHELAMQGERMRDALLNDLSLLGYRIRSTVDTRLTAPPSCASCSVVNAQDDPWQTWRDEVQKADAVWLIAPETDGYLEKMTAVALQYKKFIIGCDLRTVTLFSNKYKSYQLLQAEGVNTVTTYQVSDWLAKDDRALGEQPWLAKPNDGAGCEETVCFANAVSLRQWITQHSKQETHIIQPFLEGTAASIACVMHQGKAMLLSCNQQLVTLKKNSLHYEGCVVNGLKEYWTEFSLLANKLASLLPGITGYVGIDLIVGKDNQLTVVEINPRLTTSYIALHEATAYNPAELIMNQLTKTHFAWPNLERNVVKLDMEQHHD